MSASESKRPIVHLSPTCSLIGQVTNIADPTAEDAGKGDVASAAGGEGRRSRDVITFLGVPYAQPPLGPLRFKDPVALPLWTGERAAAEFGPVCPQNLDFLDLTPFKMERPSKISEDCLYLNVYTPTLSRDAKLPVMVWIYGGAFVMGYSDFYSGEALTALNDVVYVSINYRIGLLGFLCTGDSVATGNYGLLDQIEALRWVKEHIEHFGGDPSNVTIFGESAGAVSVSCLLMSPLARGLFKNAISESGTAFGTMGENTQTPAQAAASLASFLKLLGCEAEKSEDIVAFLNTQPLESLAISPKMIQVVSLQPVIDGRVLLTSPAEVYANGDIAKVNYMLGCNKDEGAFTLFGLSKLYKHDISVLPAEVAQEIVADGLTQRHQGKDVTSLVAGCMAEYFKGVDDTESRQKAVVALFGDLTFVHPTIKAAKLHAGLGCEVYLYSFEARSAYVTSPVWVKAEHGAEVPSVLGLPLVHPEIFAVSEADRALSIRMMKYWSNFAKTGNPNGDGLPEWPRYTVEAKQHLTLDTHDICQSSKLREERMHFWTITAPELLHN